MSAKYSTMNMLNETHRGVYTWRTLGVWNEPSELAAGMKHTLDTDSVLKFTFLFCFFKPEPEA